MKKTCLFLWMLSGIALYAHAQLDCNAFTYKRVLKNQTISISCDSLYLLTPNTYWKMIQVYNSVKDGKIKDLDKFYLMLLKLQDKAIAEKDSSYLALKAANDSLVNISSTYIKSTRSDISALKDSLSKVNDNVKSAQLNIDEARGIVKDEIKKSWITKLKWGTIGGLVGVVAGTTITTLILLPHIN